MDRRGGFAGVVALRRARTADFAVCTENGPQTLPCESLLAESDAERAGGQGRVSAAGPDLAAIRRARARLGDRVVTTPVRAWDDALLARPRARAARASS